MIGSLSCPRCHKVLEFSGDRPLFCAYCGCALAETQTDPAPSPSEAATLAPTTAPGPRSADEEAPPEVVGGFRLLRRLGGGGMGTVYEAEDEAGRSVALKIISAEYARSRDAVERFRQEGRLASIISHPRCVFVLAADEDQGRPYIVMEKMPGRTLQDLIDSEGPLPVAEAVARTLDIIEGLQEAHRLDVIHRDVKPSNCFLDKDGRVKVGDFGLSKSLTVNAHLTRTGSFMGTLLYASPEQVRGEKVDKQTDVYAVAATLYSLLVGRAPFQTGDAAATLARIVADDPPPLRDKRPEVPAVLERVILRGLARERGKRYRDLEELRQALLPFAAQQEADAASLMSRVLAYLADGFVLFLIAAVTIGFYGHVVLGRQSTWFDPTFAMRLDVLGLSLLIHVAYFTLLEGRTGASLGKRLMGLRVWTLERDALGLPRAFFRSLAFYILWDLGTIVSQTMIRALVPAEVRANPMAYSQSPVMVMASGVNFLLFGVALALLFGPMRRRNGYRGLHEWLTATRVYPVPKPPERLKVPARPLSSEHSTATDLPTLLGPFRVRGVARRAGERALLLGEDPALGRRVVILLRSTAEPPLPAERRNLARASRLRWIAGGTVNGYQWDAFPEPTGCPVPEWVAAAGARPWRQVRPLLTELTEELTAACADGTLPRHLAPEQVWISDTGRVLLMEDPVSTQPRPAGDGEEGEEARALGLVRGVAELTLEGQAPPEHRRRSIRCPLPLPARHLLDRLCGVAKPFRKLASLRKGLAAVAEGPDEVTGQRRAMHGALLGAFLAMPLLLMFSMGLGSVVAAFIPSVAARVAEQRSARLTEAAARDFTATAITPSVTARMGALALLSADLRERERLAPIVTQYEEAARRRTEELSPFGHMYAQAIESQIGGQIQALEALSPHALTGGEVRRKARQTRFDLDGPQPVSLAMVATWILATIPAFFILWTFLLRGGISSIAAGLTLVRHDGKRAGRFRCAWRSFLAWLPLTGLVILSFWLMADAAVAVNGSTERQALIWASWLTWWGGWALLPIYLGLAMWRPVRGPHDWLAGTWVVPR